VTPFRKPYTFDQFISEQKFDPDYESKPGEYTVPGRKPTDLKQVKPVAKKVKSDWDKNPVPPPPMTDKEIEEEGKKLRSIIDQRLSGSMVGRDATATKYSPPEKGWDMPNVSSEEANPHDVLLYAGLGTIALPFLGVEAGVAMLIGAAIGLTDAVIYLLEEDYKMGTAMAFFSLIPIAGKYMGAAFAKYGARYTPKLFEFSEGFYKGIVRKLATMNSKFTEIEEQFLTNVIKNRRQLIAGIDEYVKKTSKELLQNKNFLSKFIGEKKIALANVVKELGLGCYKAAVTFAGVVRKGIKSPIFQFVKGSVPYIIGFEAWQSTWDWVQKVKGDVDAKVKEEGGDWTLVKKIFVSDGTKEDNEKLKLAWDSGWRPGKPIDQKYQTKNYLKILKQRQEEEALIAEIDKLVGGIEESTIFKFGEMVLEAGPIDWIKNLLKLRKGSVKIPQAAGETSDDIQKLYKNLTKMKGLVGEELFQNFVKGSVFTQGEWKLVTRTGNLWSVEKVSAAIKAAKEGRIQMDKLIKILPERFPNGQYCASSVRTELTGKPVVVPRFKVEQGVKFSQADEIKTLKAYDECLRNFDQSTWTEAERQLGHKKITTELEMTTADEYQYKQKNVEDRKKFMQEHIDKEKARGLISEVEYKNLQSLVDKMPKYGWDWEKLPNTLKTGKRKVDFEIWDNAAYETKFGTKPTSWGHHTRLDDKDGRTRHIIRLFPDNIKYSTGAKIPISELRRNPKWSKNLFFHEVGHGKDPALTKSPKIRRGYASTADGQDPKFVSKENPDGNWYWGQDKKGQKIQKPWDRDINYFIHPIENVAIFAAASKDLARTLNNYLKEEINSSIRILGMGKQQARKEAMQSIEQKLKDWEDYLKNTATTEDIAFPLEDIGSENSKWLTKLRAKRPSEYRKYIKKIQTQISDWRVKQRKVAYESLRFIDRLS
jgi:hypothetical protein